LPNLSRHNLQDLSSDLSNLNDLGVDFISDTNLLLYYISLRQNIMFILTDLNCLYSIILPDICEKDVEPSDYNTEQFIFFCKLFIFLVTWLVKLSVK
jgi:hypothetical protein